MALRLHNSNISTPRVQGESTLGNANHKAFKGKNSEGGSISKENLLSTSSIGVGDKTTENIDNNFHQGQDLQHLGSTNGTLSQKTSWNRHISLPSAQSLHAVSHKDTRKLAPNHDNSAFGDVFIPNSRYSTSISPPQKFASTSFGRIPSNNRTSHQQAFKEGRRYRAQRFESSPFRMETLKPSTYSQFPTPSEDKTNQPSQGVSIDSITISNSKPPGFAKYVDVARLTDTRIPNFKIYEDDVSEHIVNETTSHIGSTAPNSIHPNTGNIDALTNPVEHWSAHGAEVMLREMIAKYKAGVHDVQPDGGLYNSVIHAYAEAGLPHQAENIMRLMYTDFKNGNQSAEPNVRCLTSKEIESTVVDYTAHHVLHAWRKSKDPSAPDRCEALLAEMYELGDPNSTLPHCKPDTFAVTVLLHCWVESNRPDSCEHAEAIFRQMKQRFQDGDESMRPDCISYSILLNTYAQKMMVEDAERILWEMVDDYTVHGNKAAEPRTRNFNTVLAMNARSSIYDAPERTEKVLRRYRDLCGQNLLQNQPDAYSYSLLLKAWSNCNREDGISQALSRLNWMSDLDEDAAFPDIVKYTTIIAAYTRKRDIVGAETLLHRMVNTYLQTKDKRVIPNVEIFENVIKGYTTAEFVSSSSAIRAEGLMRNMWYLYNDCGVSHIRPKGTTYKHVIIGFKKAGMAIRADELLWEMENKSKVKPSKELIQTVMNAWYESTHPGKQQRINTLRLFMKNRFKKSMQPVATVNNIR